MLSFGLAVAGGLTAAFFVLCSHVLDAAQAGRVDLLWSATWIVISVLYRPGEQLLSRTLAERRARGLRTHPLRTPVLVQCGFALVFLVLALAFAGPLRDQLFDGSQGLYRIFVAAGVLYAVNGLARGWLAGHQRLVAYGTLVVLEAATRVVVLLVVAAVATAGQVNVAVGIALAPIVSLAALGPALLRRDPAVPDELLEPIVAGAAASFAVAAAGIMLAEQTLLTAGVLVLGAGVAGAAGAGLLFNAMLVARAPLQLFQAVQTSLLPHLAGLHTRADLAAFSAALRSLLSRIIAFTALVVAALLVAGPAVMGAVFGQDATYGRVGLAAVGLGMGLHMSAGALTQAALARGRVAAASAVWLGCGAGFLAALLVGKGAPGVERAELSYAAATAVLAAGLALVYRRGGRRDEVTPASDRATPPSVRTPGRSEPVAVGTHDA